MTSQGPRVVRECALDWIRFDAELARDGSVDPVDKSLYAALGTFADKSSRATDDDPDGGDVPTRKVLAECIGRSVDVVDRATARLETRGLLRVERRRDPNNPRSHLPSVYHLLDQRRWDARAAERHAARQAKGGGRTNAATPSRTDAATRTDAGRGGRTNAAVPSSLPEGLSPDARAEAVDEVSGGDVVQSVDERDAATPKDKPTPEAYAFVDGLPGAIRLKGTQRTKLARSTVAAVAKGWTLPQLAERCTWRTPDGPQAPYAVYSERLTDLPPAPPAPGRAARPERCPDHPQRYRVGCMDCALAVPA